MSVACENLSCPQNDGHVCIMSLEDCPRRIQDLCQADGCDQCRDKCPDERAKQNIINCYLAITNGNCPSDCNSCPYGDRRREP